LLLFITENSSDEVLIIVMVIYIIHFMVYIVKFIIKLDKLFSSVIQHFSVTCTSTQAVTYLVLYNRMTATVSHQLHI